MAEFVHNIRFENCAVNDSVYRHVLRKAPLRIPAVYYDIEGRMNAHKRRALPSPIRQEDDSDIRFVCGGEGELSFKHYAGEDDTERQRLCLAVAAGESFAYTFEAGGEPVSICCRSKEGGDMIVRSQNTEVKTHVASPQMQRVDAGYADIGENRLVLTAASGEVEIEWIQIG